MTKRLWSGTCAAIVGTFSIAVAAQQNPPSPPATSSTASTQSQSSRSSSANRVTMTGCVERSSATGVTGTSGSKGAASTSEAKFMLTHAMPAGAASTGTPGAAGTSGSKEATASSYELDASESQLSSHVGHKVEITGEVETQSAPPSGAAAAGAAREPKLKVESVRMISTTCP